MNKSKILDKVKILKSEKIALEWNTHKIKICFQNPYRINRSIGTLQMRFLPYFKQYGNIIWTYTYVILYMLFLDFVIF